LPDIVFQYAHTQSAMTFILKVGLLGPLAIIDAIAIGHGKRTSFDILVEDYISPSSLPAAPLPYAPPYDSPDVVLAAMKSMYDIFITKDHLTILTSLVETSIIQPLIPGLFKEGDHQDASSSPPHPVFQQLPEPYPHPVFQPNPYGIPHHIQGPTAPFPAGGEQPPGFDDELDLLRGPRHGLAGHGPRVPIGHDDLYPQGLGPNDPFGAAAPRPGGGLPGGWPPSGMHPTPDDVLFGGAMGDGSDLAEDPRRPPPGARYDPTFPGDPMGRGAGRGRRGGGGLGNWGGFPGNDFI
jgi:hypothetical protein